MGILSRLFDPSQNAEFGKMPPRKNVSADKNRRPSGPRPEKSRPENSRPGKPRPEHRRASRPDRTVGRLDSVAESRGSRIPAARPVDEDESADASGMMRLQKFLAMAGVDSRRNCEEYIRTGRVTVDSEVVIDPARSVNPLTQDIRVDSERLRKPRFRYFLVNKPKGVLCTNSDPQGRPRAVDLVPVSDQRLFTVGRLDENTEGMLLLTNDGDLAQKLAHPRFEVIRRYRCHVAGIPQPETLNQLRDGMYFAEGYFKFRSVHIYKRRGQSVVLEMELQEGKNREIRRLMARVGHKVLALERVAFGPLSLGSLAPGQHRELQPFEIHELHHFAEHGAKPVARGPRANDGFGYRSGQTRGASRKRPPVIKDRAPQRESSEIERNERPVAERSLRPSSEGSPRARAPQREARPPQRDTDRPMRSERPTGESRGRDRMPPRDRSPADGEVRGRAAQREQRPPQREMGATARSERPSSESRGRDRMPPRDRSSADP